MSTHRSLLLAAFLASGCATTPSTPAGPPETVELRFAPRPSTAQVDMVHVRTVRAGGSEQVQRTTAHSTQRVLEIPEGFAHVDENVRIETNPPDPLIQELMVGIAERVQLIANRDGQLAEIRGLDELQPAMLEWFDSLEIEGAQPQMMQQLRGVVVHATDEDTMLKKEASDWHARVGIWNGKVLEIGRTYEVQGGNVTYRVAERVPCFEGEKDLGCVRLQLTHRPSAEEMEPARAMMEQVLAAQGDIQVLEVTSENKVEVVARPETLEPFSLKKQRLTVTTLEEAGERATIEGDDVDMITWRYE